MFNHQSVSEITILIQFHIFPGGDIQPTASQFSKQCFRFHAAGCQG